MKRELHLYHHSSWDKPLNPALDSEQTLVLFFGSTTINNIHKGIDDIVANYTKSHILGCSTSGEIYKDELFEDSLSVAVIQFEKSQLVAKTIQLNSSDDSFHAGVTLAQSFEKKNLKSLFILSDGMNVNGSQLTKGINSVLTDVIVTGGLAGDDANFQQTWVYNGKKSSSNIISAIGFYGDSFHIAHGSQGGWNKFGINRMVTKSKNNILYELDNKPALEVYKTYLGDSAKDLPFSGLLYPLMIKEEGYDATKVRTILSVNEEDQSITFAGDIPNGSEVMFMRASFAELIDGAKGASDMLNLNHYNNEPALNIAISCVGRKLVLGQKVEDELEAIYEQFSSNIEQIGYYSYGEISPLLNGQCDLHNQTMTLTLFWES